MIGESVCLIERNFVDDVEGDDLSGAGDAGALDNVETNAAAANDDRVGDIVKSGRTKMEGFGRVMSDQQVKDLLAYMHTL